ncbi:hypothetical protein JXJ21_05505 [candidate division KSB1 bacterium]|nr:hypothetical protein [candidate division KSB1 bacterium]
MKAQPELPTVDFCGLNVTRLVIGANPFGGHSHQNQARSEEMLAYYHIDRIIETWERAVAAGINTMVTNNETPHVLEAVKAYLSSGGSLQWIAQLNHQHKTNMFEAIDEAVEIGCKALFLHGARVEDAYLEKNETVLRIWCEYARKQGVIVGIAGHAPEAHLWVNTLDIVDFHAVCFFNCGSLHSGKGHHFKLRDLTPAVDCINRIAKPCMAYKIMGAGRIDARMAFEFAFEKIKPIDVVNVGIYRGDNDDMVEDDVAMVRSILE